MGLGRTAAAKILGAMGEGTDRRVRRRVLALAATWVYSARRRVWQSFAVDRDGYWVNRTPIGTVVSPGVSLVDARAMEAVVRRDWCARYLPGPGDVVVDVGAGVGEEALVFSRLVGPTGRVIAIEAHPRTAECLRRTVALSRCTNVTVLACAVSDRDGEVHIGDEDAHLANSIVAGGVGVAVPARRLDAVLREAGLDRVDFVKMNIEGAEVAALRGTDLDRVRHLCISCHDFVADRHGSESMRTREAVTRLLEAAGFETTRGSREEARPWIADNVHATRRVLSAV